MCTFHETERSFRVVPSCDLQSDHVFEERSRLIEERDLAGRVTNGRPLSLHDLDSRPQPASVASSSALRHPRARASRRWRAGTRTGAAAWKYASDSLSACAAVSGFRRMRIPPSTESASAVCRAAKALSPTRPIERRASTRSAPAGLSAPSA